MPGLARLTFKSVKIEKLERIPARFKPVFPEMCQSNSTRGWRVHAFAATLVRLGDGVALSVHWGTANTALPKA